MTEIEDSEEIYYALQYSDGKFVALTPEGYPYRANHVTGAHFWDTPEEAKAYADKFRADNFSLTKVNFRFNYDNDNPMDMVAEPVANEETEETPKKESPF